MRFHVVSLPHTHTTRDFSSCAYTVKVINFCRMMMDRGHEVFLYSGEKNEAPCTEHVVCISEAERAAAVGDGHYTNASFDYTRNPWVKFNQIAADAIRERAEQRDFLCVIAGLAQKQIADSVPALTCVEFGVGYGGTFSKFKVYESYAWMHTSYGSRKPNDPHGVDGTWLDAVIPGYLDPAEFEYKGDKGDHLLYVGRMIDRKGVRLAVQLAEHTGRRLRLAGPGTPPVSGHPLVEYVGVLDPARRNEEMRRARALIMPTIYVEPFGNVAIEAMACGTPVICTDWGAMTETVIHGKTGFRCRTFREFVDAVRDAPSIYPIDCRIHVEENYSLDVIGAKYEEHFRRLLLLWDADGWYSTENHDDDTDGDGYRVRADPAGSRAPAPARAAGVQEGGRGG